MRVVSKAAAAALLVTQAFGHPASSSTSRRGLQPRVIDLSAFRLETTASYSNATNTTGAVLNTLVRREDYVDIATALVQDVAPDAELRVVDDHYVGSNGIAHVNFKQTIHGLDVDNADFNVNVRRCQTRSLLPSLA